MGGSEAQSPALWSRDIFSFSGFEEEGRLETRKEVGVEDEEAGARERMLLLPREERRSVVRGQENTSRELFEKLSYSETAAGELEDVLFWKRKEKEKGKRGIRGFF